VTVIVAGQTGRRYLLDLWHYRELFFFLAWRDLLVRYKQTLVGVGWALIRPVLTMLALTFVFQRLSRMPAGGVPYSLLVLCGILPWSFFASALTESGNSLVASSSLISKVYFPRLVIPVGTLVTSLVDFLVAFAFLLVLLAWHRFVPPPQICLLPLFVLLAVATALGPGIWVAAAMVRYRDFRFIVPFVVQFGLYVSPVGFQSGVVPPELRLIHALNPLVGVIDGFRWCILGGEHGIYLPALLISMASSLVLLATGVWYFRKMERSFADVI
jgi:lipopolysaccharide transport system permease protein